MNISFQARLIRKRFGFSFEVSREDDDEEPKPETIGYVDNHPTPMQEFIGFVPPLVEMNAPCGE